MKKAFTAEYLHEIEEEIRKFIRDQIRNGYCRYKVITVEVIDLE